MNRIEKIQVGLIIFIMMLAMVPVSLIAKDNLDISKMESASNEKLKVTEIIDKIELQKSEDGKYYTLVLETHNKSHLGSMEVDKETFDDFQIGDLVSYERDEETGEINLEHYKNN